MSPRKYSFRNTDQTRECSTFYRFEFFVVSLPAIKFNSGSNEVANYSLVFCDNSECALLLFDENLANSTALHFAYCKHFIRIHLVVLSVISGIRRSKYQRTKHRFGLWFGCF